MKYCMRTERKLALEKRFISINSMCLPVLFWKKLWLKSSGRVLDSSLLNVRNYSEGILIEVKIIK